MGDDVEGPPVAEGEVREVKGGIKAVAIAAVGFEDAGGSGGEGAGGGGGGRSG